MRKIPIETLFYDEDVAKASNYWVIRDMSATNLAYMLSSILLTIWPRYTKFFFGVFQLIQQHKNGLMMVWLLVSMVISRMWLWLISSLRRLFETCRESSRSFEVELMDLKDIVEEDENTDYERFYIYH